MFSIPENSAAGSLIGTPLVGSDVDAGQTLTYTLTGGDPSSTFRLDSSTAQLSVLLSSLLDFEARSRYTITVTATDNGLGALQGVGATVISVLDINETPLVVPQTVFIEENSAAGAVTSQILSSDSDRFDTAAFNVTGGTGISMFAARRNGTVLSEQSFSTVLILRSGVSLNFEAMRSSLAVTLTVADNHGLEASAAITVLLVDVCHPAFCVCLFCARRLISPLRFSPPPHVYPNECMFLSIKGERCAIMSTLPQIQRWLGQSAWYHYRGAAML